MPFEPIPLPDTSRLPPPQAIVNVVRLAGRGAGQGLPGGEEEPPLEPVPEASIRAVVPHLEPQVAAMVQLQHLSGARPQEVVAIRP
jgi:hypothetical protein